MKKRSPALAEVVRLLDKISRILRDMKMRDDVLEFGQTQIERRLARLERQRQPRSKGRSR